MQINPEDMRYYVDPIPAPWTPRNGTEAASMEILALRYRRNELNTSWADRLGKVMAVARQTREQDGMWWVTEDGYYVAGPVVGHNSRVNVLGIMDDGVFVVGAAAGTHGGGQLLNSVRYSDGRRMVMNRIIVTKYVSAAPWALELMPIEGDTQAVVDQKVALAKQRYDQRWKKGEVYSEGIGRDWLHLLEDVRSNGHNLPVPSFAIGVEGTAMVDGGRMEVSDLSPTRRELVNQMRGRMGLTADGSVPSYLGIPYVIATPVTVNTFEEMRNYPPSDLSYHIASVVPNSSSVTEDRRFPILYNF